MLVSLFRLGFTLCFLVLRGVECGVVSFAAVFRDVPKGMLREIAKDGCTKLGRDLMTFMMSAFLARSDCELNENGGGMLRDPYRRRHVHFWTDQCQRCS